MHPELQRAYDKIERQRNELLKELYQVPASILNEAPNGKWSVNQILSHLITGEKMMVSYVSKKMLGIDETKDSGWFEALKMLILVISQRTPGLRFKAPGVVVEQTKDYQDLDKLKEQWETTRLELYELLSRVPDNMVKRKIYRHPVAGRLNVLQGTQFIQEHVIHHLPQIRRLIRNRR